jgi:2-polyprenyl-6-methoxyphenol hydroxylase-like FAD-dependent oxidoreductase
MTKLERYPVAIIGGGPVGLVSSILLSQQKIPYVLFERYPSTSIHPRSDWSQFFREEPLSSIPRASDTEWKPQIPKRMAIA